MNHFEGRQRTDIGIVATVVVVWVVATVVFFGLRYWSGHDESVYVAKALGGRDPFIWRPHRALGIPALLSPATGLGFGVTASRISILLFNGAAVAVGLLLWIRLLGRWVVIGPVAVLLSWLGVTNASAILPNLPAAAALFATVPALWLAATRPTWRWRILTLSGFVLIGLLRPTALLWIVLGIVAAVVLDPAVRTHLRNMFVLVAVAVPLALVTWSIESFLTFGITPLTRVREGRLAIASYEHDNVVLTLLGNLAHPTGSDVLSLVVLSAALGAAAVLTITAFTSSGSASRGAITLAVCVGAAKLGAYVIFPSDGSARFLIAGLLCISVGVGVGLRAVVAEKRWATGAAATLLLFAFVWQLGIAREHAEAVLRSRTSLAAAVTDIRSISSGSNCYFESNVSFPSFYLGSSCNGVRAVDPDESMRRMENRSDTVHSFLVWRGEMDLRPGWVVVDFGTDARWRLYHRSNDTGT